MNKTKKLVLHIDYPERLNLIEHYAKLLKKELAAGKVFEYDQEVRNVLSSPIYEPAMQYIKELEMLTGLSADLSDHGIRKFIGYARRLSQIGRTAIKNFATPNPEKNGHIHKNGTALSSNLSTNGHNGHRPETVAAA